MALWAMWALSALWAGLAWPAAVLGAAPAPDTRPDAAPFADKGPAAPGAASAFTAAPLGPGERLTLDGRLDHPAWQRAPVFDQFVGKDPLTGGPPHQATEVRVLFDADALYVGVRCRDTAPERIRDPLVAADGVNRTQDFVVVYLDATGHRRAAQFFRINAAGSMGDGMHTAADDEEDFTPDFDWDGAAHRDPQGWTAVLRIPFNTLRYTRASAGPWRMMVARRLPREHYHLDTSVLIPLDAPSFISTMQPLQGLQLPAARQFLTLRPGLTWRRADDRWDDGTRRRETRLEASLDLKWRPVPEWVLDAALNPDFSQVALDEPQLQGNTRFALKLEEKRPFFFESSDLLRTATDALYTRSITSPRWGLRSTWRGDGLAGTAFALDDRGGGLVLLPGPYDTQAVAQPASRVLAGRLQVEAGAPLGDGAPGLAGMGPLQWGLLASRRDYDGQRGHNQLIGPELTWQWHPAWRLRAQWLRADTTAQPQADGSLARGAATRGDRRFFKLWHVQDLRVAELTVDDIAGGFRNDQGFAPQAGVRSLALHLARGWHPLGPFSNFWLNLDAKQVKDRGDSPGGRAGQTVLHDVFPGIWLTGARNLEAQLEWHGLATRQRVAADRALRDERYWKALVVASPLPWIALMETEASLGRLLDVVADEVRPGARARLKLTLRPWPRVQLEPQLTAQWLQDADGRTAYRESVLRLLARWHLDAQHSLRLIAQRGDERRPPGLHDSGTVGTLTWAWRKSAGSSFYLGAGRVRSPHALAAPVAQNEVFAKLQVDVDGWWR